MPTNSKIGNADTRGSVGHERLWHRFCNTPTVLSWHEKLPPGGMKDVLETNWSKEGSKNYTKDYIRRTRREFDDNDTRWPGEKYKKPIFDPGKKDGKKDGKGKMPLVKAPFISASLSTEEGLTVEHKAVRKSAAMLCRSETAAGPDYVNVPEGLFCRSKYLGRIFYLCFAVSFSPGDCDSYGCQGHMEVSTRSQK